MKKNRNLLIAAAGVLLSGLMITFAFAAEGEPERGAGRQGGERRNPSAAAPQARGERSQGREEAQKLLMERVKAQLGASEKDWAVIEPKLTNVMKLSRELNVSGMGRSSRGGRGGETAERQGREGARPQGEAQREQTEVQKAADALQEVLKKSDSKPADIKAGLEALRKAKEKAQAALAQAQKELKDSLNNNLKYEATLVILGHLN